MKKLKRFRKIQGTLGVDLQNSTSLNLFRKYFMRSLLLVILSFAQIIVSGIHSSPLQAEELESISKSNTLDSDIVINFMGDAHNERPVMTSAIKNLSKYLVGADINIINLETAVTDYNKREVKTYNFKTENSFLIALKEMGISMVNIANNHSYDFGLKGFKDTLDSLDKLELTYVGGGMDYNQAKQGVIMEVKGLRLGFLGLAKVNGGPKSIASINKPGILNGYDLEASVSAIKALKARSDLVIILTHWGEENKFCPRSTEIKSASSWIKAGADIIVGSHSHTIQPVILKNNKLIAYSLGNFIFYSSSLKNRETAILTVKIDANKKISFESQPFLIDLKSKLPYPDSRITKPQVNCKLN